MMLSHYMYVPHLMFSCVSMLAVLIFLQLSTAKCGLDYAIKDVLFIVTAFLTTIIMPAAVYCIAEVS